MMSDTDIRPNYYKTTLRRDPPLEVECFELIEALEVHERIYGEHD